MSLLLAFVLLATLAGPVLAPQNPFDLSTIELADASLPPAWLPGGDPRYVLGTDDQGRDVLSAILYGARVSMIVSVCGVGVAVVAGTVVGLLAAWYGGPLDAFAMRVVDVQLTFPALLAALLVDGVVRGVAGPTTGQATAVGVVILSIAFALWVRSARLVRGLTLIESRKPYVDAARLVGAGAPRLLLLHILPNIAGPLLVLTTLDLAFAVIIEATLSWLGVGVSAARPSLGTLIRLGSDYLYSGAWWMAFFPGAALFILVLAVTAVGERWRDALDPRLR